MLIGLTTHTNLTSSASLYKNRGKRQDNIAHIAIRYCKLLRKVRLNKLLEKSVFHSASTVLSRKKDFHTAHPTIFSNQKRHKLANPSIALK